MAWNLDSDRPIYAQIVEIIQIQIVSGLYQPGDKLPSVRELAMEASVNPNTMQRAFAELERSGLIITQRTTGRTVTEDRKLLEETRRILAKEQIDRFVSQMRGLGFTREEIIGLVNQLTKEEV